MILNPYSLGNEEKQSVTCTEDNEEQLLIVALPTLPVKGRTSSLPIEEKNNIILPESVKEQTTTRVTQTKAKLAQRSPRLVLHLQNYNNVY